MVRQITELEKVLIQKSKTPDQADHFFNKAVKLDDEKKYAEAIACYDKVLKLDPVSTHTLSNKAQCLVELHKYEEALTCYNEAIRLDPTENPFWNSKGSVYLLQNKFAEAIACYNEAISLDPTDKIAPHNKVSAKHWQKKGKYAPEELRDYQKEDNLV